MQHEREGEYKLRTLVPFALSLSKGEQECGRCESSQIYTQCVLRQAQHERERKYAGLEQAGAARTGSSAPTSLLLFR